MPQRLFVLFGLLAVLVVSLSWSATGRATAAQTLEPVYPTSPHNSLMFIENMGQFAADARFQVRGSNHTIWLAEDAIWVTILEPAGPTTRRNHRHEADPFTAATTVDTPRRGVNLRLSFVGANPTSEIQATEALSTTISYFYGNDPAGWQPDVPVWGSVRYADLYPGLDLELVGQAGTLAPRLICHATDCAAALTAVQLEVAGAETVALDGDNLRISTAIGEWRLPLLAVVDKAGRPIEANVQEAVVMGERVERPFVVYPAGYPLFPAAQTPNSPAGSSLLYSTFLGGGPNDIAQGMAVDDTGSAVVTGVTGSADFPITPGAFDDSYDGYGDVFVARLNPLGTALVYATFLGGNGGEEAYAIAADSNGNATLTGGTTSSNFPTTPDAVDTSYNGGEDAFVVRLNPTGSALLYSTYLGGSNDDWGESIALSSSGSAYIAGETGGSGFPTTPGAFDTSYNSGRDIFIAHLDPTGSELLYSTYLGGYFLDHVQSIVADSAGNVYLTGITQSSNFPITPDAIDPTHSTPGNDIVIVKLSPAGSDLLYSTFLGGSNSDYSRSITIDAVGNMFVAGFTQSADFPITPGAFDTSYEPSSDSFVVKLNAAGTDLLYSTFVGGYGGEEALRIHVDAAGNAIFSGQTGSPDFPVTPDALDSTHNGGLDVYVAKLNATGSELLYGTFLGGSQWERGYGGVMDKAGRVYVTGYTVSPEFPTTAGAFDTTHNGNSDVFVLKMMLSELSTQLFLPQVLASE